MEYRYIKIEPVLFEGQFDSFAVTKDEEKKDQFHFILFFYCSPVYSGDSRRMFYFQKIADPGDITPSMAVGFTINHMVAVIVPFLGGLRVAGFGLRIADFVEYVPGM
jgi:hypothetical protein